ncbi:hypothetical protein BKG91_03435 [Rodentibacter caecimuris]|uniref:Mom family adenine methylcarbamoylation protein n=1 Tax=Rodentibacter caecimuris TaxID=1796644 RepID=UPI0007507BD5|nr:hypothetical protein [Rodentibacter heylii]AOF53703.1 DNA modification [Pasteurellaceae bacterium NI1060]OOF75510.1 hypothetical protein BKG91_03435 [Rodentibacter heylii]
METVSAKNIIVKPIKSSAANALVRKVHYSGKVVNNSVLHFGVFLNGKLEGVMSFGSPMDKRKVLPLVKDTAWNGMLELNRMAFSDVLPRNSESRALSIAFKLIKKHYPHIEWILSFSDGSQCGDGTIYRASGFVLTQINPNKTLIEFPDGTRIANMTLTANWNIDTVAQLCKRLGVEVKPRNISEWRALGGKELDGYQLRYIYFLNPEAKGRLTCPILPFSEIQKRGAGMYKGEKRT